MTDEHSPETIAEIAADWCIRISASDVDEATFAAFMAWYEAAPENGRTFDAVLATWQATGGELAAPSMIDLRQKALTDFRRRQGRTSRTPLPGRRTALFALSGAAAAVIAGVFIWPALATTNYRSAIGERKTVRLTDASQIALDADSEVEVKYTRHGRDLRLVRGRARFDVAKDPLRPFSVLADGKTVVATGTSFSVEKITGDVRVILYEGQVAVYTGPAPSTDTGRPERRHPDYLLSVNQELVSKSGTDEALVTPLPTSDSEAWQTGQLLFNDEPLRMATERMNRYSAEKIVLQNVDPDLRVSGIYNAGDVSSFVDGVSSVSGLTYSRKDGNYILSRAAR